VSLDRGNHGSIPHAQADPPTPGVMRFMAHHEGSQRSVATDFALPPNVGQRYGLRDARVGIDIPYPSRWNRLWTALGATSGDLAYFPASALRGHALADLFAVRYVLVAPGSVQPAWARPVLHTAAGGTVALNRTALPRAWVAYGWRQAHDAGDALALTTTSTTRSLLDQPVLEGVGSSRGASAPASTSARVVDNNTGEVTIHAIARHAGFVVLDDSAYPGWQATVDGHAVAWHPANEDFRAVRVGAGAHTVVFRYRPASVTIGAVVSVLSILALLGLAVAGAVTTRRRRADQIRSSARPNLSARRQPTRDVTAKP